MKSSNIGGQAVLEGIMMKNKDRYAVAVRKPDQTYRNIKALSRGRRFPKFRLSAEFSASWILLCWG